MQPIRDEHRTAAHGNTAPHIPIGVIYLCCPTNLMDSLTPSLRVHMLKEKAGVQSTQYCIMSLLRRSTKCCLWEKQCENLIEIRRRRNSKMATKFSVSFWCSSLFAVGYQIFSYLLRPTALGELKQQGHGLIYARLFL